MTTPKVQVTSLPDKSNHVTAVEGKAGVEVPNEASIHENDEANGTKPENEEDILPDSTNELVTPKSGSNEEAAVSLPDDKDKTLYGSTDEFDHSDTEQGERKPENTEPRKNNAAQNSQHVEAKAQEPAEPRSPTPVPEPPEPYVETDPLMASLADRMGKAMAFGAAAVTNIEVPRGYGFDLEVTGPDFWRACHEFPRGIKRKHEEEEVPPRHGFLAEDVIGKGAIQMREARFPNLANDIHPLFQRDAFDACEDDVYEQFVPALRLASMFLTEPTCSQFWVTLAMGERIVDETMTSRMGRLQHRIPRDLKGTAENATKIAQYLKDIAKNYRVHFTFVQRMIKGSRKWLGVTQKVENYSCDLEWSADGRNNVARTDLLRIHTRLSSDWYVAAKKLSTIKFPDTPQLLRFNFGFAVIITHEICHAIELAHIRTRPDWVPDSSWNHEYQQEIGHEPFFHDSHIPELGHTWEKYIFGGKVWPINDRMDCLHGLCITDWPLRSIDIWDSSKIEYHTIPMTYIEPLFQLKTWEQDFDISDTKLWHIPRNGAKSIYLHSFTTMDYNEEQRIKEEELAEQRAEHESKEPASKKRRTSINDEGNAVLLSSTGMEDEPSPGPQLDKPLSVTTRTTTTPLAKRRFKTPTLRDKVGTKNRKDAASPRSSGAVAEKAAKRVGLGTGKRR